jgi:hypothetical protein
MMDLHVLLPMAPVKKKLKKKEFFRMSQKLI